MDSERILVILPAFNESRNIARVVYGVRSQLPGADVLVIDDGSFDGTGGEAGGAGALVMIMPYNVGIGAAVQAGFQFAASRDYDLVIRNDGDGQHAPEANLDLIEKLRAENADLVVGSRFLGDSGDYGTPMLRRLGSGILARLLSIITRQRVTDPTSGCAVFSRRAILLFAQAYPHDYPEPEAIVIAHRSGLRQTEIPVKMIPRRHGNSSITPLRSVYYMIKVILAILINLLRRPPQVKL